MDSIKKDTSGLGCDTDRNDQKILTKASNRSTPRALTPETDRIRLLVVEESCMDCELLGNTLRHLRFGIGHFSCAVTFSQVLDIVKQDEIDVALVSEQFDEGAHTGVQVIECLTKAEIRSILLAKTMKRELILDAFRSGARGVFCRMEPIDALCKCIRVVHQGQVWAHSEHLDVLLQALMQTKPKRLLTSDGTNLLTKREQEVAELLADGLTNREIAKQLGLSQHTVNNYLFKSYEKLGLSTRVELVLYVLSRRQQNQDRFSLRKEELQLDPQLSMQPEGLRGPPAIHPGPTRSVGPKRESSAKHA